MIISTFLQLRHYLLLLSQLTGAALCIYFIIQCRSYEVAWYWTWLPDGFIFGINKLLNQIGTLILIMPLSIIILAILIPESTILKLASSFLGISCSLAVMASGFFTNSLLEVYNMRVLIVIKILSLEEKKNIFINEFNRIIESLADIKLQHYLELQLLPEKLTNYVHELSLLKERTQVKVYASDTIAYLTTIFNQEDQIEKISHIGTYVKYGSCIIGSLLALLGILVLFRYLTSDADILDSAKLMKEGANLSLEATKESALTAENMAQLTAIIKEILQGMLTESRMFEEIADHPEIKDLFTRIAVVEALLKILIEHVNYIPPTKT